MASFPQHVLDQAYQDSIKNTVEYTLTSTFGGSPTVIKVPQEFADQMKVIHLES